MNINLEMYKVFFEVAKCKNITLASIKLNISQPAVSKTIKNLEEQLGGSLFIRNKKGVTLTNEGQEFYKYIEKGMEYINKAEIEFNNLIQLESGLIKIGTTTTLTKEFLIDYIKEYNNNYPKIKIELLTGSYNELIKKLKDGLIDVFVLSTNNLDVKDVTFIKCKELHECFIVGNKYKHLSNTIHKLSDLAEYPFVLPNINSTSGKLINEYFINNNVNIGKIIDTTGYILLKELVKIGLGIGYTTKEFIKEELNKTLYVLKTDFNLPSRYICVAYSSITNPNFATKKFIELIKNDKN